MTDLRSWKKRMLKAWCSPRSQKSRFVLVEGVATGSIFVSECGICRGAGALLMTSGMRERILLPSEIPYEYELDLDCSSKSDVSEYVVRQSDLGDLYRCA